jgi:hypothetical protein
LGSRYGRASAALACLIAGLLGAAVAPAGVADDSTSKKIWMLKLEPDRPRTAKLGREPEIENYWYVPFKLTNEDQEDHSFFLEISAKSDKKVETRNLAHPLVKEIVRRKLGIRPDGRLWTADDLTTNHEPTDLNASFPRKLDLPVIKAGETVQCAAIFRGPDPEADRLEVTFRGLTNDVIAEKTGNPNERKLVERALVLSYERPGDEFHRTEDSIVFVGRQWVTLERVVKTDLD